MTENRDPKPAAPDVGELVTQVEHLGRLIAKSKPVDPEVALKFRQAASLIEANDSIARIEKSPADIAILADAVRTFYRQPPWVQKHILNGWRPAPDRPHRDEVIENPEIGVIQRVCKIFLGEGPPVAFHDFELRDETSPVRVIIREGVSQGKTLHALKEAMDRVERSWSDLVDQAVDCFQCRSLLESAEALAKGSKEERVIKNAFRDELLSAGVFDLDGTIAFGTDAADAVVKKLQAELDAIKKHQAQLKASPKSVNKAARKPPGKPKVSAKAVGNMIGKAVAKAVGPKIRPMESPSA